MPTVSPSSRATSSAASRQPVAPSLSPAALPAVTLPCGRKGVRSVARPARVVSGRGGSSTVARPHPCSVERVATQGSCKVVYVRRSLRVHRSSGRGECVEDVGGLVAEVAGRGGGGGGARERVGL